MFETWRVNSAHVSLCSIFLQLSKNGVLPPKNKHLRVIIDLSSPNIAKGVVGV